MNGKSTFHLTLSPENARRLTELAGEVDVRPEEFLRVCVEEWLSRPHADFSEAAAYIRKKNAQDPGR